MYKALYRKYRPQSFDSVVGQDSIVQTLKNSVKSNNFSHAYIFFGPRGVGKTTISKILARSINCLNNVDGEACGKCKNCISSNFKDCVDIIEIDAASNNGVDEIRELKSKVTLVPSQLSYKVYIIDEVHMLSIGAFNALLKTLEEPPEHVIFILATTDPQKVPETIISRCQCFSFKRISNDALVSRLNFVCQSENIDIDEDVLTQIAISSEGGMRDALGMLDKLHSYKESKITYDDFCSLNGIITKQELATFVFDIFDTNFASVLINLQKLNAEGKNLIQILSQLMYFLRDMAVDYYVEKKSIEYDIELVYELINLINEKMFDIKRSGDVKLSIEMMLLTFMKKHKRSKNISREIKKDIGVDLSNLEKIEAIKSNKEDISINAEKLNINNNSHDDSFNSNTILNIDEIMKARVNNTLALADKNILKEDLKKFNTLSEYAFDSNIGYLVCAILDGKLRASSKECLLISYEYDSQVNQNLLNLNKINEIYNKLTFSNKKLAVVSDEEWEKQRNDYIESIKSGKKYSVIKEPDEVFEEKEKSDIISSSAIELFGDIVEIE